MTTPTVDDLAQFKAVNDQLVQANKELMEQLAVAKAANEQSLEAFTMRAESAATSVADAVAQAKKEGVILPLADSKKPKGAMKLAKLTKADPGSWRFWKRKFQGVRQVNDWSDDRAKEEMISSFHDAAEVKVSHVDLDKLTFQELLVTCDDIFMPEAQRKIAVAKLANIKQLPKETLNEYYARVVTLYRDAKPEMSDKEIISSEEVLNKWLTGVRHPVHIMLARVQNPKTVKEAYDAILKMEADAEADKRGGAAVASIHAMIAQMSGQRPAPAGRSGQPGRNSQGSQCFYCMGYGHMQRSCTKRLNEGGAMKRRSQGATSGDQKRGHSAAASKGGRGGKRRIAAMEGGFPNAEEEGQGNE